MFQPVYHAAKVKRTAQLWRRRAKTRMMQSLSIVAAHSASAHVNQARAHSRMTAPHDPATITHRRQPGVSTGRKRGRLLRAMLAALCATWFAWSAAGQTLVRDDRATAKKKPAPPRTLALPSSPRRPAHEPQSDAAVVKPTLPVLPPPDVSKPPPRLPPASRERMHACAAQWSKLKLEGQGPLPMWREFAGKCLTR